ncbi:MAG: aminopeptidase P family protein [Clostridia bacterium]|nr:aminopeptidase P family protein [Clostridia bacterium]
MFTKRVKALLSSAKADVIYITSPENLRYFSGFTGVEGALILSPKEQLLLTDSRYLLQAAEEAPDFAIVDVAKTKPIDCLSSYHPKTIAFEESYVSAEAYKKLCEALPDCAWQGIDKEILLQRAVKDEEELACTRKAAKLADEAFSEVLPMIKEGAAEKDIALALEWSMRKGGAEAASFSIICASGVRSALPHGVATDKKLEKGDFVTMDFGCFYKGYASDMTRTVVVGKASDRQKKIYETVLLAQETALSVLRPGLLCKEADAAARDVIASAGYGDCFGHSLGHGTGLLIHEQPTLSPRSEGFLTPGMLVTVEPGIYIENFGGVRIEDLVYITEQGYENLTHTDKRLLEL